MGKERILELLKKVLDRSPADQTELLYLGGRSDLTRYSRSQIHQNVSEENARLYVRVAEGKRLGVVTVNTLAEQELLRAAAQALELARRQPENPYFDGFPGPAGYEQTQTHFEATARFTPKERAEMVRKIFAQADRLGFEVSGAFSTGESEIAVLNSTGVAAYQPLTGAEITVVPVSRAGMSYADAFAHDVSQIDFDRVAAKALERCALNKDQQEVPLGQYDVILEPGCLAEVMNWLSLIAFRANAFLDGTSFLAGRLGERSMGENITIYDSVHEPEAEGLAFDLQGCPKQRVTFVERGINRGVVFDTISANQAKAKPTGHAGPPDSPYGAMPWNICLEPGDSSLEKMIASCERGLLVTRFHYLNGFLNPKQALMTGMTRYGTFLIEGRKIKQAVKNLRWTESMLRAFSNVRAISREREVFSYGGVGFAIMPALYITGFTFTGVQKEEPAG
ncbi:MAG: TldD/PmbA family protein [Candidatus Acetothermia bacterium]|nr:TldD/PmbA family protein [Candidatus Acetothermia bacterium]MDH7505495.1 metallopeptidase TldD-related protein [Candidatus Acetothermia bacterium]